MHKAIMIAIICCFMVFLNIDKTAAHACPADKERSWSYNPTFPNNPSHWSDKYPDCKGKSQSPINIVTSNVTTSKEHMKLKLTGYDKPITKIKIENHGYSVHITPADGVQRSLDLENDKYDLVGFHFHWGQRKSLGSEHEVDGKQYTMEGHFVHNSSKGELAVVGVFFKNGKKDNSALNVILKKMDSYMFEGDSFEGNTKINLKDLVRNGCSYYRYNGSLTTPPCTENVKWIVCKSPKIVKRYQMKELFSLYSVKESYDKRDKCHMVNNYRPVQALNGRKIYG